MSTWKGLPSLILATAGITERDGLVHVPYRTRDGSEWNAKLFSPSGRSWWETPGRDLVPLGLETLPAPSEAKRCAIILAEGESDCLALRYAYAEVVGGFVDAVHVLGLPGGGTWRRTWKRLVEPFGRVYAAGDGDAAGARMNAAVKRDVPWARSVWLPEGEDARSILLRHGWRAFDEYLTAADEHVRLVAAIRLADDLETCEALLRGEEVRCAA
jgi:DNA primase